MQNEKQNGLEDVRLINLDEVASLLSVAKRTVYRLTAKGELPKPVKVGHSVRMQVADVKAYIERLKLQTRGAVA